MKWTRLWRSSDLLALLAFTALALLMSWPLALNFAQAIPGIGGDAWSYLWAVGWPRTALLDSQTPLFHTDYVFYPLGGATQTFWAVSLIGALALPLLGVLNLAAVYNLFYLAATVLTAYGMFLLARTVIRGLPDPSVSPPAAEGAAAARSRDGPAFAAALAFAFCALRTSYGLAFYNLFQTGLLPFYVLALLKTTRSRRWIYPLLAGVLLGLHFYLDFQLVAFLGIFSALWIAVELARLLVQWRARAAPLLPALKNSLLPRLLLLAVVAFVVAAPMLWAVRDEFALEGGDYIRVYPLRYSTDRSYDLLSYVLPHARGMLYGALSFLQVPGVNASLNLEGESQLSIDRQAFAGYTLLVLALVGLAWAWRRGRFWALTALVFSLLSLGPYLHLTGRNLGLPLPFIALHEIPIVNHIRIPMRYGLFALFPLALLAGLGLSELNRRFPRPAVLLDALAALLILAEAGILPYPVQPFVPPRLYTELSRLPGDFAILEIPSYYWRDAAQTEVFQDLHHKRLLRAYTNRIAPDVADYFSLRQTPLVVRSMRLLESGQTEGLTPAEIAAGLVQDRTAVDQVLSFFNLRFAVLHHDLLPPDRDRALADYLQQLGARVVLQQGAVTLYEFAPPGRSDGGGPLATDSDLALLYLGRGWQTEPQANLEGISGRWTKGVFSEILFPSAGGTRTLRLRVACAERARVRVTLNDRSLADVRFEPDWQSYSLALPPAAVVSGVNRLTLLFPEEQHENCALAELTWQ